MLFKKTGHTARSKETTVKQQSREAKRLEGTAKGAVMTAWLWEGGLLTIPEMFENLWEDEEQAGKMAGYLRYPPMLMHS